ncbi:hypothetical protein HanRHA438_Chr04g0169311 [Helianthus annuus]|nr:hypothetical protein HanRHA438_Chr04g0169311 [Helianthus annuus]
MHHRSHYPLCNSEASHHPSLQTGPIEASQTDPPFFPPKIDLDNGHLATKHQHGTHLKNNSKRIANIIRIKLLKTLSTIAAL